MYEKVEEDDYIYRSSSSDSEISTYSNSEEENVIIKHNKKVRGRLQTNTIKNTINKKKTTKFWNPSHFLSRYQKSQKLHHTYVFFATKQY